jgi:formimidoylglutamate deiminase
MSQDYDQLKYYQFKAALLEKQWLSPAFIGVDNTGLVDYLSDHHPGPNVKIETVNGILFPGFQNGHSHAFQYAMAGMAERHAEGTSDDFWSWREAMYQCALGMDPDQVQAVATTLYIEMLKKGYTHVAEFHYLHHDKNGKPYSNTAEISVSLLAAAATAGIKITLVPVFYQKGGFGKEAQPRQRRFIFKTVDEYFRLVDDASAVAKNITTAKIGYGVHSLRAVDAEDIIKIEKASPKQLPFHLHAAEQLKEVEDSIGFLKKRPVEWLLDNLELNDRFNIVHCTHLTDEEVKKLAASGANVVLCPGTEGNLGDGIFRFTDYTRAKGHWCIGTDSHISLNPLEDLRWLDYAQRLTSHKRNTFNDGGEYMVTTAYRTGQRAMGFQASNFFAKGKPLDGVVYDCNSRLISELSPSYSLSRILYTGDSSLVFGTLINGKWITRQGYHHEEEKISGQFKQTLKSITIG